MSDTDSTPSSSSGEIKTGRQADNAAGGFREMPPTGAVEKPKREFSSGDAGVRQAADALVSKRIAAQDSREPIRNEAEVDPVFYTDKNGERAPDNEAISLQRAQEDLQAWRDAQAQDAEISREYDTATAVDKLRQDEGITPTEQEPVQLEQSAVNDEPSVPGLDPAVQAALKLPQVRQHLEAETAKVAQAEGEFKKSMDVAYRVSLDSFILAYPEFSGVPASRMVEAFQKLGQINPQRYNEALGTLQRVAKVETAVIQNEQRAAAVQKQNFDAYAKQHDQAFRKMVGNETPARRQALGQEMIAYAKEMGVDRNTLVHLLQTNPIMRHSAFQRMIHDAVEARLAKREAAKYKDKLAPPTLPHVNRPGQAGAVVSRGQSNLAALNAALSKSGSARDAANLLIARRKGR